MFGMSFGEVLVIAIIAIIFLGPEKLPEAMVKVVKFFKSFTKTVNEAKNSIEEQIHLEELKKEGITYVDKLNNLDLFEDDDKKIEKKEEKKKKKKRKKKDA